MWSNEWSAFALLKFWMDPKINEEHDKNKDNMKISNIFRFNGNKITLLGVQEYDIFFEILIIQAMHNYNVFYLIGI